MPVQSSNVEVLKRMKERAEAELSNLNGLLAKAKAEARQNAPHLEIVHGRMQQPITTCPCRHSEALPCEEGLPCDDGYRGKTQTILWSASLLK